MSKSNAARVVLNKIVNLLSVADAYYVTVGTHGETKYVQACLPYRDVRVAEIESHIPTFLRDQAVVRIFEGMYSGTGVRYVCVTVRNKTSEKAFELTQVELPPRTK